MLRTALRPASLGLLALVLGAAAAFAWLGHWQLDRAHAHQGVSATERVVPLASVLEPASPFTGRADHQRVQVTGTYAAEDTLLVAGRRLDGRDGSWVVSALRVPGGALLPVVRGWVPARSPAPAPPTGEVHLVGRLMLSEEPVGVSAGGRVRAVSSADLVNVWDPPLYTGFLVAGPTANDPALTPVPTSPVRGALDLQNLSYAVQWWVFAAFAVLFWGKVVRDRYRGELEDAAWEDAHRRSTRQEAVP